MPNEGQAPLWHAAYDDGWASFIDPDDARAIWTMHALEWAARVLPDTQFTVDTNTVSAYGWCDWVRPDRQGAPSGSQEIKLLDAIEAATRHLEATNDPA